MPISQSRLFSIVTIAAEAHEQIGQARAAIQQWQQEMAEQAFTTTDPANRQFLFDLSDQMGRYMVDFFTVPQQFLGTIAQEQYHNKIMGARNERNKQYMAEKRAGMPKGERTKRPGQSTPGGHRAPAALAPQSLSPHSAPANPPAATIPLPTGLLTSDFTPEELDFFRREAERGGTIARDDLDFDAPGD